MRILITGSRLWRDTRIIADALADVWGDGTNVLVSGHSREGADRLCEIWWDTWDGLIEPHPADWANCDPFDPRCTPQHRRRRRDGIWYCPGAGNRRNEEMAALGADVCLAFHLDGSPGTAHCIRAAIRRGIPVRYPGLQDAVPMDPDQLDMFSEGKTR